MARSPKPKSTSRRAKKAEERASAGVSRAYPWNATFPARRRDRDGNRVFSSKQARLLDEIGGAASSAIFTEDAATPLEIEARRIVKTRICDNKSRTQHDYDQRIRSFENFCLRALPDDHEENQRLRRIDQALLANDKNFRLTETISPNAWIQYVTALTSPVSKTYKFADGTDYRGRDVGWKVVEGTWSALKWVDEKITGNPTRLRVEGIQAAMEDMRKRYVPESASAFDVAEALPRVHDAIFASEFEGRPNPFNTGIQRAEVHAMLYAMLSTCARRSLFTQHSPRMDQVTFSEQVDTHGVPLFYTIDLERWKGNADGRKKQRLLIKRNKASAKYCPVVAMAMWFKVLHDLGVKNGPLFPALDDSHNRFRRDEDGNLLRMTASTWSAWWRNLASYVGGTLAGTSTHSLRRSVVKWAARCGGNESDVVEGGRWESLGGCFQAYWRDGSQRRIECETGGAPDPVLRVWKWEPRVIYAGT